MSIRIRDLLARTLMYRPDLAQSRGDEIGMWALQESARNVCRKTSLCVVDMGVMKLAANTHIYKLLYPLHEITMMKSISVACLPGDDSHPTLHLGTFDASTGVCSDGTTTITSSTASTVVVNGFFVCSAPGHLVLPGIANSYWETGDVILSNGTNWLQFKADGFKTVNITSKSCQNHWSNANQSARYIPVNVAQEGNDLTFYPPPKYDTVIRVACAVVPNLVNWNTLTPTTVPLTSTTVPTSIEMIELPLPIEAENAVLYGALEIILRMPMNDDNDGRLRKIQYADAEKFGRLHLMEITGLRAMSLLGSSGAAWYVPSNFTGRSNIFSPWNSGRRM